MNIMSSQKYWIQRLTDGTDSVCYFTMFIGKAMKESTDKEFSWVLAEEVSADEFIANFHIKYPHKPGPLDKLLQDDITWTH